MMSRSFAVLLLISGLLLSACGEDRIASADRASGRGKDNKKSGAAALPSREVRVVRAATGHLARTVVVSGTLAADEEAELGPKVAGRLASLAVDLGSRVRRGQVLARLSPTDFELRVRQSENALAQARAQLGLPADGTSVIVDPADTAVVKQAAATLNQARITATGWLRCFSSSSFRSRISTTPRPPCKWPRRANRKRSRPPAPARH